MFHVYFQFHAQDEFGNLQYGYNNMNSVKQETGNTYTGVTGAYSYVDANNLLQRVEYVADGAGFRVADSRLPVFNPEPLVAPTFNPEPIVAPKVRQLLLNSIFFSLSLYRTLRRLQRQRLHSKQHLKLLLKPLKRPMNKL